MAASLPFGASAEEEAKKEAPPEKPKPKQYGAFGAPIRKADQSKIGVSTVKIPAQGKGNPGAGLGSVKIDVAGYKKCIQSQIYDRTWVSLACFGKLWRARSRLYRSHILQVTSFF